VRNSCVNKNSHINEMNRESIQYSLSHKIVDDSKSGQRSLVADAALQPESIAVSKKKKTTKSSRETPARAPASSDSKYTNFSHYVSWRHGILPLFEEDVSFKQRILQKMASPLYTQSISNSSRFSDSNVTGIVFKMNTVECLPDRYKKHSDVYPQHIAVKVVPFFVDKSSQRGKFTDSSKKLDKYDPTTIEARSLQILRYLILYNICPNITLLYKYFTCPDLNILKENPMFDKFMTEMHRKSIRNDALVIVSEYEDLGSLRTWRMEGMNTNAAAQWKSIIFQVVFSLSVLQDIMEFRHNDLHQANVLLASCPDTSHTVRYTIGGLNYYVRHAGVLVRLWDFDWCYCKNLLENYKVSRGRSSVDVHTPRHFDLHRFLNHVYCSQKGQVPKEVRKFIQSIYPSEYLGQNTSQLKTYRLKKEANLEVIPTPLDLLRHSYFEEYLDYGGMPIFRDSVSYTMGTKLSHLFS
jgi:hypothetical protein